MKVWLKGAISIFLGILILVTGSGISLGKMVCLKSGYTQITLSIPDECCSHQHDEAPVTIESKCCAISSMNVAILHYLASNAQHIEKSTVWVTARDPFFNAELFRNSEVSTEGLNNYLYPPESSSPPLRILTKTFLI